MAEKAFVQFQTTSDILIEGGGVTTPYNHIVHTLTYSETSGFVIPVGTLPPPFATSEYDNCKNLNFFTQRSITNDIDTPSSPIVLVPSITDIAGGQKKYLWNFGINGAGYQRFKLTAKQRSGRDYFFSGTRTEIFASSILAFVKSRIIAKVNSTSYTSGIIVPVIGDWNQLDFTSSRGDELGGIISVYKTVIDGGYYVRVLAIAGVDYDLEPITPKKYRIKFLDDLNFQVVYTIKGYNSMEHPFRARGGDRVSDRFYDDSKKVLSNGDTLNINFNTREPNIIINYPQIIPNFNVVPPSLIINDGDPYNTYISNVKISPKIIYSSGIYKEEGVEISVSDEDWLEMMTSNLDLGFSVYKEDGTLFFSTPYASWNLGDYVEMNIEGKYKVKYKNNLR